MFDKACKNSETTQASMLGLLFKTAVGNLPTRRIIFKHYIFFLIPMFYNILRVSGIRFIQCAALRINTSKAQIIYYKKK